VKILIPILIVLFAIIFFPRSAPPQTKTSSEPTPIPSPTPIPKFIPPIAEFKKRIVKKPFGLYITPATSPVQPEKFTGYHTGVDVEYGDVQTDVPTVAIADGLVIYSGWVSGYGGFLAILHTDYISTYSHLNPESLLPKNTKVLQGQTIGTLGRAYSHETDGERKHLHFGIIKGNKLDLRGYVQNEIEISLWLNPLNLYP